MTQFKTVITNLYELRYLKYVGHFVFKYHNFVAMEDRLHQDTMGPGWSILGRKMVS